MFTCSICGEIFVGIHHDSIYTTRCGHIFHHQCLVRWLERSKTCPHCRSSVSENDLVKLFLQVDPNARVSWDKKTEDKIKILTERIQQLTDKKIRDDNIIYMLETRLKETKSVLDSTNKTNELFKKENENLRKNFSDIATDLKLSNDHYKATEINKIKSQTECLLLKSKIKLQHHELYNLQSSNSYTIDQLKFEIADLKSEKAYFQRKYCNVENTNIEQPSTSKMNIETKNVISSQNQTKSKYYGHDPQLHLTSKQFLLGCVFLFIDEQIQHEDDVCNNTVAKVNVIKYGGSVEQLYSARITHIICVTQKHHIIERGLNDGKRCVTDYWLSDIIVRKKMIPPWLALHFPIPYRSDSLPCQHFQFSIDNFDRNETNIITTMIEVVGGQYNVKEVTSTTNILVSLKLEGKTVEKALAINKPVVNVQWLNDILFGAQLGLREPTNLKYQQFDLCNPFLVNYDMVSELMEAWRTPLTIHKIQRVYDLTLNPDSPTQFKRQKTNLIDDDIDDNDVIITYVKNLPPKPCVMFCGFTMENIEIFKTIVILFGGTVASRCLDATHLIMKRRPRTTIEFFGCLSTVKYILNENWLRDSHSQLKLLDERDYCIDYIQDEFLGSCNLPVILEKNTRHQLFSYLSFFITPGIIYPPPTRLEEIISSAGGTIERSRRSIKSIKESAPNSYFIISCQEDHCLYDDLLDIDNVVYLPEFITCSILLQDVQLHTFLLAVTVQN